MKIAVKLCSIGTFILCGLSSPAVYGQINDACSDAYPMTNGVTYSESTMQANSNGDPTPGCQANFGRGVWFAFTPSISGRITISTCGSDFDTVLQVYTGACASLTPMICNDDAGSACFAVTASVTFDGVAATTYRILTGGFNSARGNLRIIATVAPAPANDVCTNAIPLIAGVTNFMNTIGATTNGDTPLTCWTNYGRGVWFSFTPSISGTVTVSTCSSDFDTLVQAYTGACDSLTPVAGGCNDDFGPICSTNRASISFNGTAGTTYRLLAGGFAGTFGNLGIVATVIPTNDTCGSAVAMNVNTIYTLDTSGATSLGDPALGCGTNSDKGVWYTYKPAVTGPVRISTCGSDFDTVIQVFTGSCNLLSPLNCNDDFGSACATTRASTSFQATAGTAYRILVGGKNGAGGILRIITIDCVNAGAVTSQTNCPGTTANFSVSASGTGLSYQWYFKGNLLANQTNSVLSLASVTATNAGTYSVKVSGDCNSVTNSAALTIDTNTVATALINLVKCPGDSATFSTVALGTGPITFLWRKAGLEIAGETNNSLNLLSLVASNAGTYCVKVSGFCTSVTNCADLTILTNTTATPLTSLTLCPGSTATFTTVASGTGPFTYAWTKGGAPIVGATNASYSIASVVSGDAGTYCVKVSGFCTSVTNCATLTVLTNTTATPLTSLTLCPGQNFTFATVASGSGPFTFLWLKNGLVIAGQTNSTFSLASVTANNAGVYCVVVSGACGSVTNCVTLTVNQNVSFSVLSIENGFEASGTRINYTANFSGTQLENYNWSFSDGVNISTVSSTISRLYGPFDQIPISLSVTVSGACGPGGSGTLSTPPTCGAICLRSSIGISPTYPGTDGSGTITTNYPTFSCGDFQSNSRWFFMDKLTNATGMAFISTEGSSSDTAIGVFRGIIDPTKLDYVTCGVSTNNRPARVEFETRPGISNYWLVVRTTNSGALKLTYGYQVKLTSVKTNNAIEVISTPVPSYQWRLLATTNFPSTLVTWTPLLTNNFSTNTPASSNVVRFMDTNLPGNPRRFYRLISP